MLRSTILLVLLAGCVDDAALVGSDSEPITGGVDSPDTPRHNAAVQFNSPSWGCSQRFSTTSG